MVIELVPKGGGANGWHKMPMWQMHITPSLWPLKSNSQGGESWNLCQEVGKVVIEAVRASS